MKWITNEKQVSEDTKIKVGYRKLTKEGVICKENRVEKENRRWWWSARNRGSLD